MARKLRLAAPPWTPEDWKRATAFLPLPLDQVVIAPIRHPDNDNTWTVGVYEPVPSVQHGHKLRTWISKCETYEEAQKVVTFLYYDAETRFIGINIPEDEWPFWGRVREPWP